MKTSLLGVLADIIFCTDSIGYRGVLQSQTHDEEGAQFAMIYWSRACGVGFQACVWVASEALGAPLHPVVSRSHIDACCGRRWTPHLLLALMTWMLLPGVLDCSFSCHIVTS